MGVERKLDLIGDLQGLQQELLEAARTTLPGSVQAEQEVVITPRVDPAAAARVRQELEGLGGGSGTYPGPAPGVHVVPNPPPASTAPLDPAMTAAQQAASAGQRRWEFSPLMFSGPHPAYPVPADVDPALHPQFASSIWSNLRQGQGMLGAIRGVQSGALDPWLEHLNGADSDDAQEVLRASRRTEAHQMLSDVSGIEAAGKRIADLMAMIEAAGRGTPAAAKAAEEVARLVKKIDGLGESAEENADRLGGTAGAAAREEIKRMSSAARQGQLPGGGSPPSPRGGPGWSPSGSQLQQFAHDPGGAVVSMAEGALFAWGARAFAGKVGGFLGMGAAEAGAAGAGAGGLGAGGAAAIGAGTIAAAVAAAVAGAVAGRALPEYLDKKLVEGSDHDMALYQRDAMLSIRMGKDFDVRGDFTKPDRRTLRTEMAQYDRDAIGRAISAMGITMDGALSGMESNPAMRTLAYDFLDKGLMRRDGSLGLESGSLAAFLGQSVKAGSTSRDLPSMQATVDKIAGLIEEANKTGVASSEKLAVLAQLGQLQQGRMGFVSQDSSDYLWGVQHLLERTGLASLRAGEGVKVMNAMGTGAPIETRAGVFAQFMGMSKSDFEAAGIASAGSREAWDSAVRGANGNRALLAGGMTESPAAVISYLQRFLARPENQNVDPAALLHMSGLYGRVNTLQGLQAIDTIRRNPGMDPRKLVEEAGLSGSASRNVKEGEATTLQGYVRDELKAAQSNVVIMKSINSEYMQIHTNLQQLRKDILSNLIWADKASWRGEFIRNPFGGAPPAEPPSPKQK